MSRTNNLRKIVQKKLKSICENTYYEEASDENMYPHIVFTISTINTGDITRADYNIDIDVWDKTEDAKAIEEIADEIENAFNNKNEPQESILPTFYLIDRKSIKDEDKKIRHRLIRVLAENYER